MRSFASYLFESDLHLTPLPNTQHGSNPGGIHVHPATGEEHYVKHYHDPEQGRAEVLASRIYNEMGIKTVDPEIHRVNGREAVVTKWNPHLEVMHHTDFRNLSDGQRHDVGRMFHAAVLTKNWDIVGLVHDNILRHRQTSDLHSIDQGGAFHYRARGGSKPYSPDINEFDSLRDNEYASGSVFSRVFDTDPSAFYAGRSRVQKLDPVRVKGLFMESGLSGWRGLHHSFEQRHRLLLSKSI